jgi:hypothetical protein
MAIVQVIQRTQRGCAAAALAVALAMVCAQATSAAPALKKLSGIGELRSWFNANAGHPRLIFLLSPT